MLSSLHNKSVLLHERENKKWKDDNDDNEEMKRKGKTIFPFVVGGGKK